MAAGGVVRRSILHQHKGFVAVYGSIWVPYRFQICPDRPRWLTRKRGERSPLDEFLDLQGQLDRGSSLPSCPKRPKASQPCDRNHADDWQPFSS